MNILTFRYLLSDTFRFKFHFFFSLIIYDFKNYHDCLFREESLKNAFLTTTWNVTAFNSFDYDLLQMLLGTTFKKFTSKVKKQKK